jgi:hypothetical protein
MTMSCASAIGCGAGGSTQAIASIPGVRPVHAANDWDCLERENTDRAARVDAEVDEARVNSLHTVMARIGFGTQQATRSRMEADPDQLVVDGLLSTGERARLAAEQTSEHLSRLFRPRTS